MMGENKQYCTVTIHEHITKRIRSIRIDQSTACVKCINLAQAQRGWKKGTQLLVILHYFYLQSTELAPFS